MARGHIWVVNKRALVQQAKVSYMSHYFYTDKTIFNHFQRVYIDLYIRLGLTQLNLNVFNSCHSQIIVNTARDVSVASLTVIQLIKDQFIRGFMITSMKFSPLKINVQGIVNHNKLVNK